MAIECFFLNDTDNQNSAGPILLTIRWHVQCSPASSDDAQVQPRCCHQQNIAPVLPVSVVLMLIQITPAT